MNKKDIIAEQYKQKYLKDGKEVIRLTEYIEELKHFHTIYSAGDTDGEMAEELMMYEQLIDWLEELVHYREGEYPYIVNNVDREILSDEEAQENCYLKSIEYRNRIISMYRTGLEDIEKYLTEHASEHDGYQIRSDVSDIIRDVEKAIDKAGEL